MFIRSDINESVQSNILSASAINKIEKSLKNISQQEDTFLLLKNLCDPTKLSIFLLLQEGEEVCVKNIALITKLNQSTVSHALSDLKKLGLVDSKRRGQLICYLTKKQTKKRSAQLELIKKIFT